MAQAHLRRVRLQHRSAIAAVYALFDQEQTRRVTERKQRGACLHCHGANLALYRFVGKGDVNKGFEQVSGMPYQQAHDMVDERGGRLLATRSRAWTATSRRRWRSG